MVEKLVLTEAEWRARLTPEEFAVLVRDIPKPPPGETTKDSVDSYFRALHPNTFYRSMVVTDHKKVLPLFDVYLPVASLLCLPSSCDTCERFCVKTPKQEVEEGFLLL